MKYVARMNTWTHDNDYPITKTFLKKPLALKYIKRALAIYPYTKITLYGYTDAGKCTSEKTYKR